jgi:hypothetical protein
MDIYCPRMTITTHTAARQCPREAPLIEAPDIQLRSDTERKTGRGFEDMAKIGRATWSRVCALKQRITHTAAPPCPSPARTRREAPLIRAPGA